MRDLIGITYDATSGGPELTAAEWRQVETGLFVRDTNDLVVSGIRGGAVTNTGFSATIAPLTAVVQPTAGRGVYQAVFPAGAAELSKTISAAHATLPRVDAIDLKIYDHEADASGFRGADIEYTAGTAASSPSAPTFTGTGIRLGTFAVPASGGGNPAWTANPALIGYAAAGGILDVAGHPSNPRTPTVIYNRSTGVLEYWNGSSWMTLQPDGAAEALHAVQYAVATGDIGTPLSGAWGNVTGFSFAAVAGRVYAIDCVLFLQNLGSSTPDIKFGFNWTGAGTMTFGQSGTDINLTGSAYNGSWTAHAMDPDSTSPARESTGIGLTAGVALHGFVHGTFECTSSGTVQLEFAQATSDATWASRVQRGSRMRVERIS